MIESDFLKNFIENYLNTTFGEKFKVVVKKEQGFYKIGFRLREQDVELMFNKLSGVLGGLWKNIR